MSGFKAFDVDNFDVKPSDLKISDELQNRIIEYIRKAERPVYSGTIAAEFDVSLSILHTFFANLCERNILKKAGEREQRIYRTRIYIADAYIIA